MKHAPTIAKRLRQIWKPYVFAALAAIVVAVIVAMFGAMQGGMGVPVELVLACLGLLAAAAALFLAVRGEALLSDLKNRLGQRRISGE